MENNLESKSKQEGRLIAGLMLVVVGVAWLLRNAGFPLPNWLFSWPMILILSGIYSGVKHNFRNNSWFILIGIGLFFLFDNFVPGLTLQPYFWPLAIIVLGIVFILRPASGQSWRNRKLKDGEDVAVVNDPNVDLQTAATSTFETDPGDSLSISSVFSGVNKNVVSKNFQGGKISCVFGGADIDLTKAELTGKTELKLEVVFGGVKLVVPSHWTILNEVDGVFHGIDDRRKFGTRVDNPDKILLLKGSVVFGGVEIRSY